MAERVASERGEAIGESVGYQIRLEQKRSAATRLLFCTTGVLLRKLVGDPRLNGVSHVMVDEIHERGMNEDFLLIILRDLLPRRPDLKLVLMSATLNAAMFAGYFGGCPTAHIPGFTFPVEEQFLDYVLESTGFRIQNDSEGGGSGGGRRERGGNPRRGAGESAMDLIRIQDGAYASRSAATQQSLRNWHASTEDKMNLDLVEAAITHVCTSCPDGAVLVFLTGWDDIKNLAAQLKENNVLRDSSRFLILPLHGSMPTAEQKIIFRRPPQGVRKVVLATNIAETSITIDDIVYVIDGGKSKEKTYDAVNNLGCLLPAWVSRAAARQRRGRAGRVQAGMCIHLFTHEQHEAMAEYQTPELLRTPLEELCLQIKSLKLGMVAPFLAKALEPPSPKAVANALELLCTIGAMISETEELTPLGQHLAALPVDPKIGKMLLMGALFGCIEPVLTIAAGLAHRDPFLLPMDKKEQVDEIKSQMAGGSYSDHIALLKAYDGYEAAGYQRRQYAHRHFLSENTLRLMGDMRSQFRELLADANFLRSRHAPPARGNSDPSNRHGRDMGLVKAVLCAGMFPNVVSVVSGKRKAKLRTREDGMVEAHPGSVNAWTGYFPGNWMVYSEKVKSTGIYIRDASLVPDLALLLFGGALQQGGGNGTSISMLHGWANFNTTQDVAALVIGLRGRLDVLLQAKIDQPALDFTELSGDLVDAVVELMSSEGGVAATGGPACGDCGNCALCCGGSGGSRGGAAAVPGFGGRGGGFGGRGGGRGSAGGYNRPPRRGNSNPAEAAFARDGVADIVRKSGGSYGMARLSGFLKQENPQLSAMMGPIRKFIDENSDLFSLQKEGGSWVVRLLE